MSVEWNTRSKPTRHKQSCERCCESMEKFETQTVRKHVEWGYGACYTNLKYYHPICAMKEYIDTADFRNHFRAAYLRELNPNTFKEVFDSHMWLEYRAHYILAPFEILGSLHLDDAAAKKFLEEVFTGIVFDSLLKPVV